MEILIMHPRDMARPVVSDDDIELTLRYGPLQFKAFAPAARLLLGRVSEGGQAIDCQL
jgi:hypothetical protein